jgi:hypothetical protein
MCVENRTGQQPVVCFLAAFVLGASFLCVPEATAGCKQGALQLAGWTVSHLLHKPLICAPRSNMHQSLGVSSKGTEE